jgi:hypothetical protein
MPRYIDGSVDNWNVEILFHALKRMEDAKKELQSGSGVTHEKLENIVNWERLVADRALWLRDRALTHALEYLSEPADTISIEEANQIANGFPPGQ